MAKKKYKIKWSAKDTKKVANTVRQFNAKITRTLKKHPELADYLPERISTKQIRSSSITRQDLNRQLNSFNRFLRKNAEMPVLTQAGTQTTQWQKREVSIGIATINRSRSMARKKYGISTEKGTMGTAMENNLFKKSNNFDTIPPERFESFIQNLNNQMMSNYTDIKKEAYKQNYLQGIRNVFGQDPKASALIELLSNEDEEVFTEMLYSGNPDFMIDFMYDEIDQENKLDQLIDSWMEHLNP